MSQRKVQSIKVEKVNSQRMSFVPPQGNFSAFCNQIQSTAIKSWHYFPLYSSARNWSGRFLQFLLLSCLLQSVPLWQSIVRSLTSPAIKSFTCLPITSYSLLCISTNFSSLLSQFSQSCFLLLHSAHLSQYLLACDICSSQHHHQPLPRMVPITEPELWVVGSQTWLSRNSTQLLWFNLNYL